VLGKRRKKRFEFLIDFGYKALPNLEEDFAESIFVFSK
jgi:hypothetical protein